MPVVRYQIRNEYGLADPELYGAADKEDPEALLEGVAMAGLVGVLRQLGDLAEFAAEIFHDLHEEVLATASRGHALTLRVQQLELDFPATEKDFLSQTSPSQLSYSAGIDWHPNLHIDQNLIIREDMPRFILDSYEESRGPPRLFMLDKFDIAGDGACLKRYSDPSFFKMDFAASGKMEPDIQREKKSRKNKKKIPRWRNGETPESYITPYMNPKLEHVASEKPPENPPVKRVKLKTRQLNDNTSIRRIYMEHVSGKQSPAHANLSENSISHSQVKIKILDSTELATKVHEVIMDTLIDKPSFRERNQSKPYNKEEVNIIQKDEVLSDTGDGQILNNEKNDLLQIATGEVEKLPPIFDKAGQKELLFAADRKREGNDDAESRTNGSLDGFRSEDAASELDNYLDALTTMDSEIETDNETRAKPNLSFFSKKYNKMDSNVNEERELLVECLDPQMFREPSTQNSLSHKRMSSPPNGDSLNSFSDSTPSDGTSRAPFGMLIDQARPGDESHGMNLENKATSELFGKESSTDLIPRQMMLDMPGTLAESGVEFSSSSITDTTALIFTSLHSKPEDIHSVISEQNMLSSITDSTEKIGAHFDGECSSLVNSDVQGTGEDVNFTFSKLVEGREEVGRCLADDFHQRSDEYKVPSTSEDYVNPGLVAKDMEIFSDALLHLGDEPDLKLQMQDNPSLEEQVAVLRTEETSAEGIMPMPSVSDLPRTNYEVTSSVCVEDSSLPLSTFKEKCHESVCQDPKIDSGEDTLPPVFTLDKSSSTSVPDGLFAPLGNSVLSNEKFECARSITSSEDAAVTENEARSYENTGSFAENEVIASGTSLSSPSLDIKDPQESYNLDQVEFTQEGEFPKILNVHPNFFDYESRDSPSPTGEHSGLNGAVPVELLPAESSPDSVIEFIETGEMYPATMHSKESSSCNINLQEGSFSSDVDSEQQKLEVPEVSCSKYLMDLDVQQFPGTAASQGGHVEVTGPQDSESAVYVLDSPSQPDYGEHSNVYHPEQLALAKEDLHLSDGNEAATSFVKEKGEKPLKTILQNESDVINSDIEHNLVNIEAHNSDDLTATDNHQASKIAFPDQEKYDAVNHPGDSAESIHESFEHVDSKPVICASPQEDQKMGISPQDSRTEETLLESSETPQIESVKHAEVNMHHLDISEVVVYPFEIQEVSHSNPLASGKPSQTANGDVFLSSDVITECVNPLKELSTLQSSNEIDDISLQQKFGSLNISEIQFEKDQTCEQDNCTITDSQPSVPEATQDSVEAVSSGEIYELGTTSVDASSLNQLQTEVDSSLQSSFGSSVSSAFSSALPASLPTFSSLGFSSTGMIKQQSSELPLDDDPPLPPLPPLQWRMGKLRPNSVMTNGEMTRPQSGLNQSTILPSLDHSLGSLVMDGALVQPSNPFLHVEVQPNDSDQFSYLTLAEGSMNSFQSSALLHVMEDKECQDDMLALDVQMKCPPANSFCVVAHVEDNRQKNDFCQEALNGEISRSSYPFTLPLASSDAGSQQFPQVCEGEPIEPPKPSASEPTLGYTESQHGTPSMETSTMHPFNPFLSSTSREVEDCQYDYGTSEGGMAQHMNCPDTLSTAELAAQGFLVSQGGNMQTFESVAFPAAEHEKPNGRPRSLLNRPRDPLIEAVASHDKSTLRKVSELVRPSAGPEGERNTLLEQIRNKSFSLKPATVAKPSIKGPPTNLKVAAILERANAIRQAFVGSDEEDDGDSWSDS